MAASGGPSLQSTRQAEIATQATSAEGLFMSDHGGRTPDPAAAVATEPILPAAP
jgi:hypothetical protein